MTEQNVSIRTKPGRIVGFGLMGTMIYYKAMNNPTEAINYVETLHATPHILN